MYKRQLLKSLSLVPARTGSAAAEKTGVKTLAALFAVTFAVYAAAFLAVYPGIYSYDASVDVYKRQVPGPPVISVRLCSGTVPTFRRQRRSGRTERQNVQVNRKCLRSIR